MRLICGSLTRYECAAVATESVESILLQSRLLLSRAYEYERAAGCYQFCQKSIIAIQVAAKPC